MYYTNNSRPLDPDATGIFDLSVGPTDDRPENTMEEITSDANFREAWRHLEMKGGPGPGPNGHTYRDFTLSEKFELMRCLRKAVQDGTYRPGPERKRRIPKTSGKGHRVLTLRNIEDRIVERAVMQAIAPLFGSSHE